MKCYLRCMSPYPLTLVGSAATVIVYDTIASLISKRFNINYARFTVGSFILYAGTGLVVSMIPSHGEILAAACAGATVGFIDSSVGWAISSLSGAGQPRARLTPSRWPRTAALVTTTAMLLAAMGCGIGILLKLSER